MTAPHWLRSHPDEWRARAVRLLAAYFLLALALLTSRYLTRDVRPDLLAARQQEAELTAERDIRELRVQILFSGGKVQSWAQENSMIRFAEATKISRNLGNGSLPPAPQVPPEPLKVKTQWN